MTPDQRTASPRTAHTSPYTKPGPNYEQRAHLGQSARKRPVNAQCARNQGQPTTTTTSPAQLMEKRRHLYTGRTGAPMHTRTGRGHAYTHTRVHTREARPVFGLWDM